MQTGVAACRRDKCFQCAGTVTVFLSASCCTLTARPAHVRACAALCYCQFAFPSASTSWRGAKSCVGTSHHDWRKGAAHDSLHCLLARRQRVSQLCLHGLSRAREIHVRLSREAIDRVTELCVCLHWWMGGRTFGGSEIAGGFVRYLPMTLAPMLQVQAFGTLRNSAGSGRYCMTGG